MLANKPVYFFFVNWLFYHVNYWDLDFRVKNNSFLGSLINYRDFRDTGPRAKVKVYFLIFVWQEFPNSKNYKENEFKL